MFERCWVYCSEVVCVGEEYRAASDSLRAQKWCCGRRPWVLEAHSREPGCFHGCCRGILPMVHLWLEGPMAQGQQWMVWHKQGPWNLKPAIVLRKKAVMASAAFYYYTSPFYYTTRHLTTTSFWAPIMACDEVLRTHFYDFFSNATSLLQVYIQ